MRYFDPSEPTVIAICMQLNISENKFHRNRRKLLAQIYKYEQLKEKKIKC